MIGKHRDPKNRRRKPLEEAKPVSYEDLEKAREDVKQGKDPRQR